MHRRKFNAGLALATGMAPLAGRAQTAGRMARVGMLTSGPPMTDADERRQV